MYTTNFVVAEMHGLLLNRLDRDTAQRTLDRIYAGSLRIVRATERDEPRTRNHSPEQGQGIFAR